MNSEALTLGTPDANGNGAAANSIGSVEVKAVAGAPGGANDSDVRTVVKLTDVRCQTTYVQTCNPLGTVGADYTGEIAVFLTLRITDRLNGRYTADLTHPGTGTDVPRGVYNSCTATADTSTGGSCSITFSWNAVLPGVVQEGKRSIWDIVQIYVADAGNDGKFSTLPNLIFARPGLFVP